MEQRFFPIEKINNIIIKQTPQVTSSSKSQSLINSVESMAPNPVYSRDKNKREKKN